MRSKGMLFWMKIILRWREVAIENWIFFFFVASSLYLYFVLKIDERKKNSEENSLNKYGSIFYPQ